MKRRYGCTRVLCLIAGVTCISLAGGMGLGRIEPAGKGTRLIQFDVLSDLNMDEGFIETVVFARYWVCRDYYAVSVIWTEPHGLGLQDMKTAVVLSDRTAFQMANERYQDWIPTNSTYPKPVGERGAFRHGAGIYEGAEMRYADAEVVARRVYVDDLAPLKDPAADGDRIIDLKDRDDARRKVAQLKVHTKGRRIESMELFNEMRQPLCRMKYEYTGAGDVARLGRLVATLPVRPEKLAVSGEMTTSFPDGGTQPRRITDIDHVHHEGGRTCTVVYEDVSLADTMLRLPVRVEVRVTNTNRLLRSARLMNFKRVDLDKSGVWETAKAFAHMSDDDEAHYRLVDKYLSPSPRVGPLQVDPNDLSFVRGLLARYPLPEVIPMPTQQGIDRLGEKAIEGERPSMADAQKRREDRRRRQKLWEEQIKQWQDQIARTPKPARREIEPNDVRVMRQLCDHYQKTVIAPLTEEQKKEFATRGGKVERVIPERQREIVELHNKMIEVLSYHRVSHLPEDDPPEMEPTDFEAIQRWRTRYNEVVAEQDQPLGTRFKVINILSRLDRMVRDYDAFEEHTVQYLRMADDGGLSGIYVTGGYDNLEILMAAGQYEKANRLLRPWAERSAASNDPDGILRFARWEVGRMGHWWTSVHVLDRFLKRTDLTSQERYEALALRGIALHNIDLLLRTLDTTESKLRKAQGQWVLSTTSQAALSSEVEPALREALSAWQSLGPARQSDAKPYSTMNAPASVMDLRGSSQATPLQETSAMLDSVIRQRSGGRDAESPRIRRERN